MNKKYYDKELTEREFEGLKKKQEKLSTNTQIYKLSVEYLSGITEDLTLVGKEITFDETNVKSQDILALYSNDVITKFSELNEVKEGIYEIPHDKTTTKAVILTKNDYDKVIVAFLPEKIPLGTKATANVSLTSGKNAVWAGVILLLLIASGVIIRANSRKIAILYYHFRKNNDYHKIKIMIADSEKYLDNDEYDKASLIYKEIKMSYEKLADFDKNRLYKDIIILYDLLNKKYLEIKLNNAKEHPENAKQEIEKAKLAYNKLRKELKELVYPELNQAIKSFGGSL